MDKNITVENLVKLYDEDKSADKKNFNAQLKVEKYIPYERKVAIAEAVFNAGRDNVDGKEIFNSTRKYFFYCLAVINTYTNIKVTLGGNDDEDPIIIANLMYAEFNEMNSRALFELIFKLIPEKELNEFNTILDMITNDYIENNLSVHGYIDNLINSLINVATIISKLPSNDNLDVSEGDNNGNDQI